MLTSLSVIHRTSQHLHSFPTRRSSDLEVITKDNVPVRVNAVAYFRIIDPEKAIVQVENFMVATRSEEHTSELQSRLHLVCRLLLEKKKRPRWPTAGPYPSSCPGGRAQL